MRLIGPNCLGILNTDPRVAPERHLRAGHAAARHVGFLSQSGALGLALIDSPPIGLGVSSFVSIGNNADISGNDLLEYWEGDEGTDVALLYIESFSDPRRSRGSPAGSGGESRSSSSRAAARSPARAPPAPTPARCSPPPTSPSTPSSSRPA